MVDLLELLYGAVIGLGTLAGLKLIDIVLERIFDKTIFRKAWFLLSKEFKKLITRLRPIRIRFEFSSRIERIEESKVKPILDLLSGSIAKKQQITFSPMSWI